MSEDIVDHNGTDEAQDKKKKVAKHDGGVADLERVTDYAEEKEISSADISNVSEQEYQVKRLFAHAFYGYRFWSVSGDKYIRRQTK